MGYVTYSIGTSEHAEIIRLHEPCDWPKCRDRARWEVSPRGAIITLIGGLFCTTHARATVKKIERVAKEQGH